MNYIEGSRKNSDESAINVVWFYTFFPPFVVSAPLDRRLFFGWLFLSRPLPCCLIVASLCCCLLCRLIIVSRFQDLRIPWSLPSSPALHPSFSVVSVSRLLLSRSSLHHCLFVFVFLFILLLSPELGITVFLCRHLRHQSFPPPVFDLLLGRLIHHCLPLGIPRTLFKVFTLSFLQDNWFAVTSVKTGLSSILGGGEEVYVRILFMLG